MAGCGCDGCGCGRAWDREVEKDTTVEEIPLTKV